MKFALPIRIELIAPPRGVMYGIQRGKGSKYSVDFSQQPKRGNVVFDFEISVDDATGTPHCLGDYVQGSKGRRLIYVVVGSYAGQQNTPWARLI